MLTWSSTSRYSNNPSPPSSGRDSETASAALCWSRSSSPRAPYRAISAGRSRRTSRVSPDSASSSIPRHTVATASGRSRSPSRPISARHTAAAARFTRPECTASRNNACPGSRAAAATRTSRCPSATDWPGECRATQSRCERATREGTPDSPGWTVSPRSIASPSSTTRAAASFRSSACACSNTGPRSAFCTWKARSGRDSRNRATVSIAARPSSMLTPCSMPGTYR